MRERELQMFVWVCWEAVRGVRGWRVRMGVRVWLLEQGELLWAWALCWDDGRVRVLWWVVRGELRDGRRGYVREGSRLRRDGGRAVCERELRVRFGVCGGSVRALRGFEVRILVWG